jgi:large subunit ribosomal protein L28
MARKCELTGKALLYGKNVSHANNRSSRRFLPNLQNVSFLSASLARLVKLRVTPYGIRCVESRGGLDNYLLSEKDDTRLSKTALKIKRAIIGINKGRA